MPVTAQLQLQLATDEPHPNPHATDKPNIQLEPFEPHISGKVMDIYYTKHRQVYANLLPGGIGGYYLEPEKLEFANILTPNSLLPPVPIIDI
ncbi:hypothetical protein K466DRAFT_601280 [Polyporus arcularius HHB13444]|uniref:Uncharacterized protein n=1 Tax=Polyporus arcularius HHB13444 TaxID=1314778 RepID=A0A5C3P6L2_9APHY|nr:hypothetical protein K466DRAFT_601280 [Polyporus arcularius HHB13444]